MFKKKYLSTLIFFLSISAFAGEANDSKFNICLDYYSNNEQYKEAFNCFNEILNNKNDKQNYIAAKSILAEMYYNGFGTNVDKLKAFDFYLDTANEGFLLSQLTVGKMYLTGDVVEIDEKKGFYYFEKAALKGSPLAQTILGSLYFQGIGVLQNYEQSFYWNLKASYNGMTNSQHDLSILYYYGFGTERDLIEAYAWASISVLNGNKDTNIRDAVMAVLTTEKQILAQKRAIEINKNIGG